MHGPRFVTLLVSLLVVVVVMIGNANAGEISPVNVTKYNCSAGCNCRPAAISSSGDCEPFPAQQVSYNVSCDPEPLSRTCVTYSLFSSSDCLPNSTILSATTDLTMQCKTLHGLMAFGSGEVTFINSSAVELQLGCFSSSNDSVCEGCTTTMVVPTRQCTLIGQYTTTSYYIYVNGTVPCTAFTTSIYYGTSCAADALVISNVKVANVCVNNTLVGCEYAATSAPPPTTMQPSGATTAAPPLSSMSPTSSSSAIPTTTATASTTSGPQTRSPTSAPTSAGGHGKSMSDGEKFGIIGLGAVFVLAFMVIGIHFYRRRLESVPATPQSLAAGTPFDERSPLIQEK